MPATLATLAAPGVTGLYYVDLDAVVEHPWTIPQDLLAEHRANLSDVSFGIMDVLRWKVHGSRFYVRDTSRGRDFFAAWFRHRCTCVVAWKYKGDRVDAVDVARRTQVQGPVLALAHDTIHGGPGGMYRLRG